MEVKIMIEFKEAVNNIKGQKKIDESALNYLVSAKDSLKIARTLSPHISRIVEFKEALTNIEYLCNYFLCVKE